MTEASNALHMTYVVIRCNRWGIYERWLRRGEGPERVVSQLGHIKADRVEQMARDVMSLCPVDMDDAQEVARCVAALPPAWRLTMVEEYIGRGTQEQKASRLGILPRAYRARRDHAHVMLLELFNLAAANLPLELAGEARPARGRPHLLVSAA